MEYLTDMDMHPLAVEMVFWALVLLIIAAGALLIASVMSNGDAQGREWPENQWPSPGCTPPTRADRKTGFTRE